MTSRQGRGRWFLVAGMAGEGINLAALLANNLLAPRWLSVEAFGDYVQSLAPAFVALGLIDAPQALRIFVVPENLVLRLAATKLAVTAIATAFIASALGVRGNGILASILAAAAYSSTSAGGHLGLRRGVWYISPGSAGGVLLVTIGALHAAGRFGLTGVTVLAVQAILVLAVGTLTFAVARATVGKPYRLPARDVSAAMLAVPGIMGVSQWALVAVVGAVDGPTAAAIVRIATSVTSAPAAVVPLSGALILAHSRHADNDAVTARRTIAGAIVVAAAAAGVGVWAAPVFLGVLGHDAYAPLKHYIPILLAGGVGYTTVYLCWPMLMSESIRPSVIRLLAAGLTGLCAIAVAVGARGYSSGLVALSAAYGAAGILTGTAALGPSHTPGATFAK